MNIYFRLAAFLLLLCNGIHLYSQESPQISGGISLLSQQYWRGFSLSSAPGIQAETCLSYGNFNFCLWGAVASNLKYSELDIIPSFSYNNCELFINHYYNPIYGQKNNFFDFGNKNNRHSTELLIVYYANKIPFNLSIGTFIFGDKNSLHKPNFSTYIEIGYPFSLKWIEAEITTGMSPAEGYYAKKASIIHTGLSLNKNIELKNGFSIPLSLALNYNPYTNNFFIILKAGIFR